MGGAASGIAGSRPPLHHWWRRCGAAVVRRVSAGAAVGLVDTTTSSPSSSHRMRRTSRASATRSRWGTGTIQVSRPASSRAQSGDERPDDGRDHPMTPVTCWKPLPIGSPRPHRVTVLTGAGISTDSGIPDFRGPNGRVDQEPGRREDGDDPALPAPIPRSARAAWQNRLSTPAWTAEPNAGHRAIVELERQGKLHALVTQNIDGLHQRGRHRPRPWWSRSTAPCAMDALLGVRRPAADGARRSTGCAPARTTRRACVCGGILKSRHDQLRPEPRARGDRPGDAGERRVRPDARRRLDARRVPGGRTACRSPNRRAPGRDRQRRARPRWTTSPTPCCAAPISDVLPGPGSTRR